jgi:Uma2 family endonuclease
MSIAAQNSKMSVDEFLRWADSQQGDRRYELLDGEIVAQANVVGRHTKVVKSLERLLDDALPPSCTVYTPGGVFIDDDFAPICDLMILCGRELGDDERYVPDPVIVIEVLSPSTAKIDMGLKRDAYQRIPALEHYLVVHPVERFVLIHSAGPERDWSIVRSVREDFALDPPGVTIPFEPIFARLRD